jgi:hypothetical protein
VIAVATQANCEAFVKDLIFLTSGAPLWLAIVYYCPDCGEQRSSSPFLQSQLDRTGSKASYVDTAIQGALIGAGAGLAGTVIGGIAAWWAASTTNKLQARLVSDNAQLQKNLAEESERAQRAVAIEAMILKLSDFAIEYPTLEKDSYCQAYPACPGDPNGKERYESYCVYVFNMLSATWDFCKGDAKKIASIVGAEELIRRHYRCWQADPDNLAHNEPFPQYVQSVINDLRKAGKIQ